MGDVKPMRDIGKNIKQLRTQKNMTQDELAERIFVTRQTVSNYENGKSRPDVDMLVQIAQVLETDIQQLIYGPEPKRMNAEAKRLILSAVLTAAFGLVWAVFDLMPRQFFYSNYDITLRFLLLFVIQPVFFALLGWFGMQMIGMALGKKPLQNKWLRRFGLILLAAVLIWFGLNLWFVCAETVNSWQYHHHIRGQWDESHQAWSRIPAEVPKLVKIAADYSASQQIRWRKPKYLAKMAVAGAIIWLCGVPEYRRKE